jgi:hypothetical protein
MAADATLTGASRAPMRPGWLRSLVAVLGSSILAGVGCGVVLWGLGALHLVPFGDEPPGSGWPWRVDGAWAAAADAGPTLAVSFAFAAVTSAYLHEQTGVRSVRWPLVLIAATVGWLPLTGGAGHGLVVVSGVGALAAVVIAARWWSILPRRRMPWSRPLIAGLALAVVALGAASVSYGALHPLGVRDTQSSEAVTLRHGRSERLRLDIENRGPLAARVERIAIVEDPVLGGRFAVRIAGVDVDSGRRVAPTIDGLYKPWRPRRVSPGESMPVYVTLAVAGCSRRDTTVDLRVRELDIRLRTAGRSSTQRVRLERELRVGCEATRS